MTPREAEPLCLCPCRPGGSPCGQWLAGIELDWGVCILCHGDDHWKEGDDDPAFDWPAIFEEAQRCPGS